MYNSQVLKCGIGLFFSKHLSSRGKSGLAKFVLLWPFQEFTLVQDSFTGLLTRNFCKRSFIPQAMTHADLRPLRRSIGIARFHFILVFAFMFRALWSYGSVSAGREKWANFVLQKYFLALHCDQTVGLFQLFSTVLKRFCPVQSKNTLVLVLAHFFD